MVSENMAIALIGFGGSAIGSLIGIVASSKLTQYRIEMLEKKVDKHNSVVERTFKLEESVSLLEEKDRVINHRIDDLKEKMKGEKSND